MIISRKHLSRRTFLRGVGAVIGLPLLDAIDCRPCEPGDPVDFDPEEFVIERLRELDWFET